MSPTMVIDIGAAAPAPRPWMTRNTISEVMFQASAPRIEPSRNSATPARITGLRPIVSASLE